jgi:integrase
MKAKRTKIEPNIYRYPDGRFEVLITVNGQPSTPCRFPADTTLATVRRWRDNERERLETAARGRGTVARYATQSRGTLDVDALAFFEMIKGRSCFKADRSHLRAWLELVIDGKRLGGLSRFAITKQIIERAIAEWQTKPSPHTIRTVRVTGYAREACAVEAYEAEGATVKAHLRKGTRRIAGYTRSSTVVAAHQRPANTVTSYERSAPATSRAIVSPLTIRHRCRVLDELFRKLGNAGDVSPVAEVTIPARPKALVTTVPPSVVIGTLQRLKAIDAATFARFAVAATTGQRPCQVGWARPEDVELTAPAFWMVRPAKNEPAHPVELNADGVAAWQAMIAADAFGEFDTSRYGNLIHEAGWPHGVRPYAARHSLAKAMIAAGCHLGDIQAHLGHSDPKTTRIYAPFVRDRQREVSNRTAGYLADVFKPRLVSKGRKS